MTPQEIAAEELAAWGGDKDLAEISLMKKAIALLEDANAKLKRFVQRVDRGDPRVCKPEFANPKYFEKFGDSE
jgi:hypothetical protein